jgi:N-acetylglucosamine-6-phosphate deacetylase
VLVELHADDRVTLRGGERLAGSSLKLTRGIANTMRFAGLSLNETLTMVTRNPARAGRISGRQRGLEPGERADLVEFQFDPKTKEVVVEATYLDGELVCARS